MSNLPLIILETVVFPIPITALIVFTGAHPVRLISLFVAASLTCCLIHIRPIHSNKLQFHEGGFGYLFLSAILLLSVNNKNIGLILTALMILVLCVLFYTTSINYTVSPAYGISGGSVLIVLFIFFSYIFNHEENLNSVLSGKFAEATPLLGVPVLVFIFIFLKRHLHLWILEHLPEYTYEIPALLFILLASGLLIPSFPLHRIQDPKIKSFCYRLIFYIPLLSYGLSFFSGLFLLLAPAATFCCTFIIVFTRRSLYNESRITIINFR